MQHHNVALNGIWNFVPDPFVEGEHCGWQSPEYDAIRWKEVTVPAIFDNCGSGMESYEGVGWFRRTLPIPKEWRGLYLRLHFDAVNYTARVYVNGTLVGDNADGFLPFDCDITDAVNYGGDNTIVVRTDNTRRSGEVPGLQRGWRPFGGILRTVSLVAGEPLHIGLTKLTAWPDGTFVLNATIENAQAESANITLDMVIEDSGGTWRGAFMETSVVPARQSREVIISGRVTGVTTWTPDNPTLYKARLRMRDTLNTPDRKEVVFGFRRIETRNGRLELNGQPLLLLGFNRHEDSERAAMCVDVETTRQDLMRIKETGANFVRLCHYPHDSATLSLCDEIGLLVMAEIPLYWWGDQDEDHSAKLSAAKRQLTRLIDRDYNHPSIIFWSVSNETQERQSYVVAGNAELVALAKKLDPSRFATHVSNQWTENPHFEEDDLCCINGYPTWGGRRANPNYTAQEGAAWWKKMLTALHAKYPDKPILVTEFGYPAIHEVHDGCIAEEEQARVLEAELPAILSESYVSGATLWCWADHPWIEEDWICRLTTSPFGVVGRDRKSKAGLSATRRLFREAAQRPSLLLRKTHLNNLPAVTLPAGYSIRNATPKDVEGLATCLQKAFPEMTWTADNACAWLIHDESVKATFVIEFKGEIVATASARLLPNEFPGAGYIHWVGADPSHRGKNLGYLVSLATLHEFVHLGCQDAVLHTDDFRVPAIKVYLKLGFRPEYAHATHPRRWSRLLPSLPKIELP